MGYQKYRYFHKIFHAHFAKNRLSICDAKNELLKVKNHRLRWSMEYIYGLSILLII